MNKNMLQKERAKIALEYAKQSGCDNARVTLSSATQSSFTVRNNQTERIHQSKSASLYIQLFTNDRYGSFSTNRMETAELKKFIEEAVRVTKLVTPDTYRSLPDKSLYYTGNGKDLEQHDNSTSKLEPSQKNQIAFDCSSEIYKSDPRIISVNSEFSDLDDYFYMIDSQGFEGESRQSSFSLSCECSVKGKGESRPEGWWYESSIFFDSLKKNEIGKTALERALSRLGSVKLKSGKYNMVLENTISSRVIAPIISALNGASLQQNNSFLKDMAGKKVFDGNFRLFDNPHLVKHAGSRYFDGEGIATKPMAIIENGVVNSYFINTYYSKKLKMPVTIEGPSVPMCKYSESPGNNPSGRDLGEILKHCGNGVLVTGFNGGNTNSSTGDFSFGAEGFVFENGIIKHPVNEINITGNIITLWNNLIDIGNDPRTSSRWLIPTLAFENVNFSGI
ncbi:MAG: TldD/PmbA family protein [Bacteroidia bacterium]|jgi:PmbA protein|nr:TldD/PmbA family protein [Bacteroidales bacterium]MDD3300743.1 TldD/PmbA family protein [Bacteroidales bacterium]MDD3844574.1 TldD/PmbA family protein [Bacteroidales bacterium]MDD4618966.1 TldD/PmbA family protein [Bacteroidales bacterium]NCC46301.1 TldD/PmbA family protein [Bacteroidia bacterium]